jgi:hypothetical protein
VILKLPDNFFIQDPNEITFFTFDTESKMWTQDHIQEIALDKNNYSKMIMLDLLKTTPIAMTLDAHLG